MKKKQIWLILIFATGVLFSSCETNTNNQADGDVKMLKAGSVEFKLGYSPSSSGTVSLSNREYLYFGDTRTFKCIDIVSFDGTLFSKIPLNEITNLGHQINDFYIKSIDSILVLSLYSNQLFLINNKGNILKQIDLNRLFKQGKEYGLYSSIFQDFYFKGKILLNGHLNVLNEPDPFKDWVQFSKYLNSKIYSEPYFFQISNVFTDSMSLNTGLDGFYLNFVTPDYEAVEGPHYYHTEDRLFCLSGYSDKIYEIDPYTFKIIKQFTVSSDFTKVSESPVPINKQTEGKIEFLLSNNGQTQGAIGNLLFDKYRNLFYVFVYHSVNADAPEERRRGNRPWSLLTYNENFEKMGEQKMPALHFEMHLAVVCKEGLLISTNNSFNDSYERSKAKFALFKVSN